MTMRTKLTLIEGLLGSVIVVIGLYQAFALVNPYSGVQLSRVLTWAVISLAGVFYTGYVAMKYTGSPTGHL